MRRNRNAYNHAVCSQLDTVSAIGLSSVEDVSYVSTSGMSLSRLFSAAFGLDRKSALAKRWCMLYFKSRRRF